MSSRRVCFIVPPPRRVPFDAMVLAWRRVVGVAPGAARHQAFVELRCSATGIALGLSPAC